MGAQDRSLTCSLTEGPGRGPAVALDGSQRGREPLLTFRRDKDPFLNSRDGTWEVSVDTSARPQSREASQTLSEETEAFVSWPTACFPNSPQPNGQPAKGPGERAWL